MDGKFEPEAIRDQHRHGEGNRPFLLRRTP
jgi:hypothetical protein